ncbi:uncharacterized protein LOC129308371 [Prosopis cineraria]|uniref:uncharacterized protein LOC129308371 n=1 Tax=Prosopis cineraria TaxID=364024 RepID=UPI00240EABE1|nr:uncharacterized protein LOC129298440 isoform X1 [Prosopis cineraria]XP_054792829.1 uncharacterized protein LOC129298440 isoform X1 [Prosopis cineraria]XP_054805427.1 uncharacterized protein LOC129308371 [Prosopis cineraria]
MGARAQARLRLRLRLLHSSLSSEAIEGYILHSSLTFVFFTVKNSSVDRQVFTLLVFILSPTVSWLKCFRGDFTCYASAALGYHEHYAKMDESTGWKNTCINGILSLGSRVERE